MGSFVGTAGDEGTAPISLGVTWMGDSDGGNASGGLELSEGAIVSIARLCLGVRSVCARCVEQLQQQRA